MLKGFLIGGSIGLVLYALRVQFMPDFGNVWIRPDQYGIRRFRPMNLLHTMMETFRFKFMWRPDMLDINWVVYLIVFGALGSIVYKDKQNKVINDIRDEFVSQQ